MTCKSPTLWDLQNCGETLPGLQALLGLGLSVEFTVGAEDADVANVAVQINDVNGDPVTQAYSLRVWLSDAAGGAVTADPPSGGTVIGTDGAILASYTANVHFQILTEDDGTFDLDLTEAGTDTWYLNVQLPDGSVASSTVITFAA